MTIYYAQGSVIADGFLSTQYVLLGFKSDRLYTFKDIILRDSIGMQTQFDMLLKMPWFNTLYIEELEDESGAESYLAALLLKESVFTGRPDTFTLEDGCTFIKVVSETNETSSLISDLSFCYEICGENIICCPSVMGTDKGISLYNRDISRYCENILLLTTVENTKVVIGYKHTVNSTVKYYGPLSLLTDSQAFSYVRMLLDRSATGLCLNSIEGKPYAYFCLKDLPNSEFGVQVMNISDCNDKQLVAIVNNENKKLMSGIDLSLLSNKYGTSRLSYFDEYIGNTAAINSLKQTVKSLDARIYYKKENGNSETTWIYALYLEGVYASIKDIISLQYTFDTLSTLLGNSPTAYFDIGELEDSITIKLAMPNISESSNVTILSVEDLTGMVKHELDADYDEVTKSGISFSRPIGNSYNMESQEGQVYPTADGLTLSYITRCKGNPAAIKEYHRRYNLLYPQMSTSIQSVPTDLFSRSLPAYSELVRVYGSSTTYEEENTSNKTEPEQTSFFSSSVVDDDDEAMDIPNFIDSYDSLNMDINASTIKVKSVFEFYDCCNIEEAVANYQEVNPRVIINVQDIKGYAANNLLPVQSNELNFFIGLRNLVFEGICTEKKLITINELNEALNKGITSEIVDEFIQDMCQDAYTLNWKHTGHVENTDDEDSDDSGDSTTVTLLTGHYRVLIDSSGKLYRKPESVVEENTGNTEAMVGIETFPSGWQHIRTYISSSVANSLGWAETLIRLLRWGSRKPDALSVPTSVGKRLFLNMQSLAVSDFSGDFSRLTPISYTNIDGTSTTYVLDGIIHSGINPSSLDYIRTATGVQLQDNINTPCGLILSTFTRERIVRQTFMDIFTAAMLISSGNVSILGVSFDNCTKKFVISDEIFHVGFNNDIEYCVGDTFSIFDQDNKPLSFVRTSINEEPLRCTMYGCKMLIHTFERLSAILENNAQNAYPIFELLNNFNLKLDKDFVDRIVSFIFSKNPAGLRNTQAINKSLTEFQNQSGFTKNQSLRIVLFAMKVMPMFAQLYGRIKDDFTLADILNTALTVIDIFNSHKANGEAATSRVSSGAALEQFISHYTRYYCVKNPLNKEPFIYFAGEPGKGTLGLWTPQDLTNLSNNFKTKLSQMTCTDFNFANFVKIVIYPSEFSKVWQSIFGTKNPKIEDLNKYSSMLASNFVLAVEYPNKLDTYHQAILNIAAIQKSIKASQRK